MMQGNNWHTPSMKMGFMVLLALVCGIAFAYVNASPGWHDTGLIVVAMVLLSGGFSFFMPAHW